MHPVHEPDELELRHYIRVLWRRKLVVLFVVALTVGGAIAYTVNQRSMYRATAEVLLQSTVSEAIFQPDPVASQAADRSEVETEMEVMRSRSIQEAVTESLGRPPKVSITQLGGTDVVAIRATNEVPEQAALVAQVYAETYVTLRRQSRIDELLLASTQVQARIDEIRTQIAVLLAPLNDLDAQIVAQDDEALREDLQTQRDALAQQLQPQLNTLQSRLLTYAQNLDQLQVAGNLTATGGAQIVSNAAAPNKPFSPQPTRNAAAALGLGLILGVVGAFVRDHLDDSVRSKDDLEVATSGTPVLALVPAVKGWRRRKEAKLVSVSAPHSAAAEAYRALRTSLDFVALQGDIGIVQVTSPEAGEGKTTTLSNLGIALARAGRRVVMVDCDLRRPRLHGFFGLSNEVGFTTVLLGHSSLAAAIQPVPDEPRLALLSSGAPPPNPAEFLSYRRTPDIFSALRDEADFVLVDSPPVLPVADSVIVAGLADAVILVVRAGDTSRRATHRAFEVLSQVDARLIGTVLNVADAESGYGYRYGYSSQAAASLPLLDRRDEHRVERPAAPADGDGADSRPVDTLQP